MIIRISQRPGARGLRAGESARGAAEMRNHPSAAGVFIEGYEKRRGKKPCAHDVKDSAAVAHADIVFRNHTTILVEQAQIVKAEVYWS